MPAGRVQSNYLLYHAQIVLSIHGEGRNLSHRKRTINIIRTQRTRTKNLHRFLAVNRFQRFASFSYNLYGSSLLWHNDYFL